MRRQILHDEWWTLWRFRICVCRFIWLVILSRFRDIQIDIIDLDPLDVKHIAAEKNLPRSRIEPAKDSFLSRG